MKTLRRPVFEWSKRRTSNVLSSGTLGKSNSKECGNMKFISMIRVPHSNSWEKGQSNVLSNVSPENSKFFIVSKGDHSNETYGTDRKMRKPRIRGLWLRRSKDPAGWWLATAPSGRFFVWAGKDSGPFLFCENAADVSWQFLLQALLLKILSIF